MASQRRLSVAAVAQLAADLGPSLVPAGHHELLRSITETARRLFGAGACSIALLSESGEELQFIMASGAGADAARELRVPATQGIAGWVVSSGQAIAIDDVAGDPRFAGDIAAATGYVPRSILAMPLETERRVLGVIELLDRQVDGERSRNDMELLGVFAAQAALAIETAAIFGDLGRALLEAMAAGTSDAGMAASLRAHAERAPRARADVAELAAIFQELGEAGSAERRLAVELLRDVLRYARRQGTP